jgi:hypothetical protein
MLFQYANLSAGSLRLVRFRPSSASNDIHLVLEHQDRYYDDDVHYSVLAYDESNMGEMKSVMLQGRTKLVPLSLWEALNAMFEYHDTSGRFWIDFVSINMKDDEEKRIHDAQLPNIYAAADQVLVWLGTADESMESALADLATYPNDNEHRIAALDAIRSRETVKAVINTPAMTSAKKIVLVCGRLARDIDCCDANGHSHGHIRQLL